MGKHPWMGWKTVFMDAPPSAYYIPLLLSLVTSEGHSTVNNTSISMYRRATSLEGKQSKSFGEEQ
jgi:hypothetical protein